MLRRGFLSKYPLATSRLTASTTTTTTLPSYYHGVHQNQYHLYPPSFHHQSFSTLKDVDEDDDKQSSSSSSSSSNRSDTNDKDAGRDALRIFFDKRRAALQADNNPKHPKHRSHNQQQQNQNHNNRPNNAFQNNNDNYNNRRQWNTNYNNNNNNNQQYPGRNYNNNNNNNRRHKKNNKYWENRQHQNPNRSQQQQQKASSKEEDDSRLKSLLEDLRRNAKPKATTTQGQQQQQQQQQHQDNNSNSTGRLSWRPGFPSSPQGTTDGTTTTRSREEHAKLWKRSFLRKDQSTHRQGFEQRHMQQQQQQQQQQQNNNNNKPKFQHRAGSAFLMGELSSSNRNQQQNQQQNQQNNDNNNTTTTMEDRIVTLPNAVLSLTEASSLLRRKMEDIDYQMRSLGSTTLDVDTMELLAMEFGIETERAIVDDIIIDSEALLIKQRRLVEQQQDDDNENDDDEEGRMEVLSTLPPRAPVVCIMGHVDHGKTTLMDALRRRAVGGGSNSDSKKKKKKSKKKKGGKNASGDSNDVAGTEAGGITQIISAFEVALEGQDNKVTFLDTPGHAAFKSMRLSGTHAADVIVLVIAADDGVSAQTIEILDFYKSIVKGSDGGIAMVVALNKIDKPGIEVDEAQMRIENQLLEQGIVCEGMNISESEFGPPVQVIPTSGLTGLGLDDLMEGLLLQSDVMDLRADDQAHAEGIVMDARMEKGLGAVVDCIVRWGSIQKGDVVVSGTQVARVRMLKDVNDKMMKKGLPSQPVRLVGFNSLPKAGDPIICVESEEAGEEMVKQRALLEAENDRPDGPVGDVEIHVLGVRSRENSRMKRVIEKANLEGGDGTIRIPIIVKADADGSLSAVRDSLIGLGESSSHDVIIDPVLEGIGEVTATDIQMAKESEAVIFVFGFKRIDPSTLNLAEQLGVTIECNEIIYSLLDEAKDLFSSYLPVVPTEHVHGRGMVQAIFEVDTSDGAEKIAGMRVTEGNLYKEKGQIDSKDIKVHFRVLRDNKKISPDGEVITASSLRHFKDLVDSAKRGEECGLGLSGFSDFKEGDIIECYSVEMKNGTL